MRKKLLQEDMKQLNGMFVASGAIIFEPDETYPIFATSFTSLPTGQVTDIRREDDGWITGEIDLIDMYQRDEDSFDLSTYCTNLEGNKEFVKSARLRAVVLLPRFIPKI